ncbi:hypothetical protein CHL78_002005 [Romboutsia weinsteinii]|uniref:OCRE domain-containing protein n=1 Tax=Romboutsia weinsteinii TaxID=2020949 RepID=A0A371J9Z7_9FIRM|nr:hypothetical protein [Romboutsia weinsteinii]RDY29497.1 hypothetical protein CHL78_002005 [Romboutsia weinsteinii]
MKRGIITLSILCSGILMISPISNLSFAEDANNKEAINGQVIIQNTDEKNNQQSNIQDENKETNIVNTNKSEETKGKDEEANKEVVKQEEVKQEVPKQEIEKIEEKTEKVETSVEVVKQLNKEQAKELLESRNQGLQFEYQGDENNFSTLKEKGLSGYVFLPNVDGDMGYFVDKNTSNVYYFHPSGYMDLMI